MTPAILSGHDEVVAHEVMLVRSRVNARGGITAVRRAVEP
jgi:hypothetical protein